jgi:hypothetical protein
MIIRRLKVDRQRFTFIDLESGKGRALLIPAQYPLKSVIGVEFSQTLHDVLCQIIRRFTNAGATRTSMNSINRDAESSIFPRSETREFSAILDARLIVEETIFAYLGGMPSSASGIKSLLDLDNGIWYV